MKDVVKQERLQTIEGVVPKPTALPPGCHFEPRCPYRMPRCREGEIPLYPAGEGVTVRCVLYDPATVAALPQHTAERLGLSGNDIESD
jgi:ABC-type dipeptide/oligopeptide/nickel transport system ATPase component